MEPTQWERAQEIFHDAALLPAAERAACVEARCGGDAALREAVLAMLAEDERGDSVLDGGVGALAGELVGADSPEGQEFGPYRVLSVLGEGGMGIVYLAERADLGARVAVKLLRDSWMSPARRGYFAREQRTLAQLTHPGIARIYDASTTRGGAPWFAMEYVDGVPPQTYCDSKKCSIAERIRLVRAVCEAVRYAHSLAVIHCDLKPGNILVRGDGTVKLLDFGIARQIDESADAARTGPRFLTPGYAAPEQLRGERPGVYTDVYSLGVLLRELLGAEPGPDLTALCAKATREAPQERYASVEAMIRDIDHYLAGQPLEARPSSPLYRAGKFLRRNARVVAAASVAAALLLTFAVRLELARKDALTEAARAQRVLRFTLNLFKGGDREAGPARDLRVTTLLDRGVAEAGSLSAEPGVQAELYETLGEVYQKLGEFDRAGKLLRLAWERRQALEGPGSAAAAESEVNLGLLRADQAKLEESEQLVREGLALSRKALPAGHPGIAFAVNALGHVLIEKGAYKEAIGVLEEAVRLRSGAETDPVDLGDSLLTLANARFYAGDLAEAEALNRRLLDLHGKLYGARHPLIAEELINLGAIEQERGNYAKAEEFHRRALSIMEEFYGKDHFKAASSMTLIARALVKLNRPDEALALLRRGLAIQEKVFGPAHPRVASAVNEIGTSSLIQERYDEAEAAFRRMAEIYRGVYGEKHYLIGIADANLGSVYMARKDNPRAEALFRQALAMYARTLPAGHVNFGITQIKLGRVLLRQNRYREAEAESLAGFRIVSAQASPSVTWLKQGRADLAAIYTALGDPGKAKEFTQ